MKLGGNMNSLIPFTYDTRQVRTIVKKNEKLYGCHKSIMAIGLAVELCEKGDSEQSEIMFHNAQAYANELLDDMIFNVLYGAARMHCAWITQMRDYEYSIHSYFKNNIKDILGDTYSLLNKKSNGKDIPDAWVGTDNTTIPVEIKRGDFDKKALRQLLRYLKSYNCNSGIAVGRSLMVKLPSNIKFLSCEGWN
jgi:hypothetical protein